MSKEYGSTEPHGDHAPHEAVKVDYNEPVDESKPRIPAADERPFWVNGLLLVLLIGFGMLEGAAFERSGIVQPNAIAGQMVFKVWIVMKLFITAVGASMFFQGVLNVVISKDFERSRFFRKKNTGFVRVITGSLALGAGMALCGSGPTMLPAQVGSGVSTSWVTFLGLLAGAVVFAIIEKVVPHLWEPPEYEEFTLDSKFPRFRYEYVTIPMGLLMIGVSIGLEFIITQKRDAGTLGLDQRENIPWYPTIAGAIVGFGQVPMRLIAGHGQGGSTSIMVLVSTLTCGFLAPKQKIKSFTQVWQLAFVWVGTLLGGLASSQINDQPHPEGFTYWRSFVGGFLMLFGARIAGGCTCGHGISGFAELSFESVIATCCIFGGGIATGFIVEAAGGTMCMSCDAWR